MNTKNWAKDELLGEPKKKCRDDWKKAKELEEARKAGTAPAAVDEEGKDINPHIPQYISASPWYYGSKGPTLKHQRIQPTDIPKYSGIDEWYKRGVNTDSIAIKYRSGACENCGAMTHKKKDCMERPRKIGAKFNSTSIAPDEFVQPVLNQSYDGKRDRWAGYDPSEHKRIIEQYQRIEEAKRQLRADKLDTGIANEESNEIDDDEDEDKYVDEVDMPGTKVDSKQRITVRNLRIREDTAKYLRNLDINSAYYDPKTRSMRDNPHKDTVPEQVDYAGENFVRFTGDTSKHATAQLFAWEAYEKGVNVHLLAEPTKLEKLKHEYEQKKDEYKKCIEKEVLEKYGGEEHLTNVPPKELLLAQTEEYREYSRSGKIIKGEEKAKIRSRYQEDVYVQNHTSVWGSYWCNGEWGYSCCHSFVKNSYCTGDAGKAAAATNSITTAVMTNNNRKTKVTDNDNENKIPSTTPSPSPSSSSSSSSSPSSSSSSASSSSSSDSDSDSSSSSSESDEEKSDKKRDNKSKKENRKECDAKLKKLLEIKKRKTKSDAKREDIDDEKLKEALKKQAENDEIAKELTDDRKRRYNSMYDVKKPTDEEMEAYYMKKRRDMDPMADLLTR